MALFGATKKEKEMQSEIERLRALIPPQGIELLDLQTQINNLNATKNQLIQECNSMQNFLTNCNSHVSQLQFKRSQLEKEIVNLEKEIVIQEYGIYRPTFDFAYSDMYKDRLNHIRNMQKDMISMGTACMSNVNWSVNGNPNQGQKLAKDTQKLILRAFNVECDDIVKNVTIANFPKSKERIGKTASQMQKLGEMMSVAIAPAYVKLKVEELCLALDFKQKKQEEKERIREAREQQREEARVQKELEEARKKLLKEQTHYRNALSIVLEQLRNHPDDTDLLIKKKELENNISDTEKAITDVDYREANKRAGYVYIISNIGAFGENVYKIGMTRRLEPMERVDELGDASVPFKFDVHALIFSEDAPSLESALHRAFEDKKVNKINPRREFFKVSLEEIKAEVRKNFDKTVEWVDVAEAEQYRQSLVYNN